MIDLRNNIARVQERMAEACRRAGRRPEDVKLVAVSKTVPPDRIRAVYDAGLRDFLRDGVVRNAVNFPSDSLRLAQKLDEAAVCSGDRLPVLLEVNLGEEQTKSGVREQDVLALAEQVVRLRTLELSGLMVLPPFFEDPEQARPFFRRLRELARTIESANLPGVSMRELSMGMSHDFEVAIEEGATMVRIGTAIFGRRM